MRKNERFPSESEVIEKLDSVRDIPIVTREITDIINGFIETPIEEFDAQQISFIEHTLPLLFSNIVGVNKPSKKIIGEINLFTEAYIKLTIHYGLHSELIRSISKIFDSGMRKYQPVVITNPSKETREKFLKFTPDFEYLSEIRPHCNQIVKEVILQLFTAKFFECFLKLMEENTLDIDRFAIALRIYNGIESSLTGDVVTLLLPTIVNAVIKYLKQNDSDTYEFCHFLAIHFKSLQDQATDIMQVLCEMSEKGKNQTKINVISEIIDIATDPDSQSLIIENADIIKDTFIKAINTNQSAIILGKIYGFLPKLSAFSKTFTIDDIQALVERSKGQCPGESLVKILDTVEQPYEDFAEFLIKNDYYYPELYSILIKKIRRKPVAKELFHQLLQRPDRLRKGGLEQVNMNKRIKEFMEVTVDDDNPSVIESLAMLFLKAPQLDCFKDFIVKVVDFALVEPRFIDILKSFSSVMNSFPSSDTINEVFDRIFDAIYDEKARDSVLPLRKVLSEWIQAVGSISPKHILDRFATIDFSCCPDIVPEFFDTVMAHADRTEGLVDLYANIIKQTVQPQHAHWAVWQFLDLVSGKPERVREAAEALLSNGSNYAAHMIYEAALYEADFFRLGSAAGIGERQEVRVGGQSFIVSLSPLHSTRRLFAEVSSHLNLPMSRFKIFYYEQGSEIEYGAPYTYLKISQGEPLIFSFEELKGEELKGIAPDEVPPTPFLDCLLGNLERLSEILRDTKDDGLFMVACLLGGLTENGSDLVGIVKGECCDPMVYAANRRIFPYALRAYARSPSNSKDPSLAQQVLQLMTTIALDSVSFGIVTDALPLLAEPTTYPRDIISSCLVEAEDVRLRVAMASMLSHENPELFISLIPKTLELEYRSSSKQFYEFISGFDIPSEVFLPFFKDLQQYEKGSNYASDETFIALASMIPVTEETISITLDRLFSNPTVSQVNNPFLQTTEARQAAFNLLKKDHRSIPQITSRLNMLSASPSGAHEFSDDFTSFGRNGINNMGTTCYINAVLQILVAMPNVVAPILQLPAAGLKNFMLQLRNLLGRIKFSRGPPLSIQGLSNELPGFNPNEQEDAEEFFNMLINNVVKGMKENKDAINEHICGVSTTEFRQKGTDNILSSRDEDFYYIGLATKGLHNIQEAFYQYFEDNEISEYSFEGVKVEALQRVKIKKWPNYLVLQLRRWDYHFDTMQRTKLMEEMQFPIEFQPPTCDDTYTLSGVIIHQGDAESGHYVAIVNEGNMWYFCNDNLISKFSINELGNYAFGGANQFTGYLLFYRKIGIEEQPLKLTPDLEAEINAYNTKNFPSQVFFSDQFIRFIEEIASTDQMTPDVMEVTLTTFFRIAVVNETAVKRWNELLTKHVLTSPEQCMTFFNFCNSCLKRSLGTVFSISDTICEQIGGVFRAAFMQLLDTTEPLKILLNGFEGTSQRRAMAFALELMILGCEKLTVDWSKEEDALYTMTMFLTGDTQKEVQRQTKDAHFQAYDRLAGILAKAVKSPGCAEAISAFLDGQTLGRFVEDLKKSDNFLSLLIAIYNTRPDLLQDLTEAPQKVQTLVNSVIPVKIGTSEIDVNMDVSFYMDHVESLIFTRAANTRQQTQEILAQLLGTLDPSVKEYFWSAALDPNARRPEFAAESSFAHYLIGLMDVCLETAQRAPTQIAEYIDLLSYVCYFAPRSMSLRFPAFADALYKIGVHPTAADRLMFVLHHLAVYDRGLLAKLDSETVRSIAGTPRGSYAAVELVLMAPEVFTGSELLSACVEFILVESVSSRIVDALLMALADGRLSIKNLNIPQEALSLNELKAANRLWEIGAGDKKQLAKFMKSAIKLAVPFSLFQYSRPVKEAIGHLAELGISV